MFDKWDEIREILEPQQCGRGHPSTPMINTKNLQGSDISMFYTCATCEREIRYDIRRTDEDYRMRDMAVVNEGDIDPSESNYGSGG